LYKEALAVAKAGKLGILGSELVAREIEDYISRRVAQAKGITNAGK